MSWNAAHSEVAGTLEERIRIPRVLDTLKEWSETIRLNSVGQEENKLWAVGGAELALHRPSQGNQPQAEALLKVKDISKHPY